MDKGIWILALLGKVFRRGDDHVNGQHEFLANRQTNGVAALGPVVKGFEDDEEVNVAVGAGVAAGVAAEEDDLFGIEAFGDQFGYSLNRGPVNFDFAHVQPILWQRFSQVLLADSQWWSKRIVTDFAAAVNLPVKRPRRW